MDEYIGLDVSLKETAVSIRRGGKRVWRGKCLIFPRFGGHARLAGHALLSLFGREIPDG